jgi:hypothetical protein
MLAGIRGRLTYANVIATLAVFIALGASAWALGRNSVGPRQIKPEAVRTSDLHDNAVKSAKVDDGSLLSEDFAAGELPTGPQGEQGTPGQQGAPGPPGEDATNLFAYVQDDAMGTDADAELVYDRGVASLAEQTGTGLEFGEYRLLFDRSLANCVVHVTPGFGAPTSGTKFAEKAVAIVIINPDGDNLAEVRVDITNVDGGAQDSSFFIAAFC